MQQDARREAAGFQPIAPGKPLFSEAVAEVPLYSDTIAGGPTKQLEARGNAPAGPTIEQSEVVLRPGGVAFQVGGLGDELLLTPAQGLPHSPTHVAQQFRPEAPSTPEHPGANVRAAAKSAYESARVTTDDIAQGQYVQPATIVKKVGNAVAPVIDTVENAGFRVAEQGKNALSRAADSIENVGSSAVQRATGAPPRDVAAAGANTARDVGRAAADRTSEAASTAASMPSRAAESARETARSAADTTRDTARYAADTASSAASRATNTVADTGRAAAEKASEATSRAADVGRATAQRASAAASSATNTALETGKAAASKTADLSSRAAATAADTGRAAAGTAATMTSRAAGAALDMGRSVAETATAMPGKAVAATVQTSKATANAAQQVASAAQPWAEAGVETANSATRTVYHSVIRPIMMFTWWLFVQLPMNVVRWTAHRAWRLTKWAAYSTLSAVRYLAINSSAIINRMAEAAYRLMLNSLRRVNGAMDQLVSNTPRLVRDTLEAARYSPQAHVVQGLDLAQETDVAREANETLHQVFDKQELNGTRSSSTLLAEARKLAWHAWMLIALQVTAVRTVFKVTEGMLTWVGRAWLQLIVAGFLLTAMGAAAPLAAFAAVMAWTTHFILRQVVWLRGYHITAMRYVAPPVHSGIGGVRRVVNPYLQVPATSTAARDMAGQQQRRSLRRMLSVNNLKATLAAWLDTAENMAGRMIPHERETAALERGVSEHKYGRDVALQGACSQAEEAWAKTSSLATATAFTVVDVLRVLLLGICTRFNLPLPGWIPGVQAGSTTREVAKDPSVHEFLHTAGKGPASSTHIGIIPSTAAAAEPAGQKVHHTRKNS